MKITWVLEKEMFSDGHARLAEAAQRAGHNVEWWQDAWMEENTAPDWQDMFVLFHGSLGCANHIRQKINWKPGAFCHVQGFQCSQYYSSVSQWLVHQCWHKTTVEEFINNSPAIFEKLNLQSECFVRPDSPLKPFSGRVLHKDKISLKALDFGFYYEDIHLPIMVTPIRSIGREWRFVAMHNSIIASSEYIAEGRSETRVDIPSEVIEFAQIIVEKITPPDILYVLDIAECDKELRLMELNPFSGADLYNCDRDAIVTSVSSIAET